MKTLSLVIIILISGLTLTPAQAQDQPINTIFSQQTPRASGGYGAITNKFTTINGQHANIAEVYGGWYINHKFLLGFAVAGVTNDLPVLPEFGAVPGMSLSYEYGHVGLMTEYVVGSGRAVHVAFQLFSGAGFTMQYERHSPGHYFDDEYSPEAYDEDWFFVAEPGVQVEVNVFRWMRFSPGISYRAAFNSHGRGLSDDAISAMSYNLTLKFGKF